MKKSLLENINQNLKLFLHPIYDAKTMQVMSYEVLSRLPVENNLLPPPAFMDSVCLNKHFHLARAVLKRVEELLLVVDESISLHVNFNPEDLEDLYVFNLIKKLKKRIVVEITEESGNLKDKLHLLKLLKEAGVKIALDDFGDQNSTYNYILDRKSKLNLFDIVKIDKNLVAGIAQDKDDLDFLRTMVYLLKKNSSQKIVLEYIENEEIKDLAIKMGCHGLQGFFFGKPFDSEKIVVKKRAS